jgi:N-acetyl-gamma-glutamyl-phosphate reductase
VIATARLVANPGCYPTCTLLPLLPLLEAGLIHSERLVVDAKSGVTGAGRTIKRELLFSEVSEGMAPYAVGAHRHTPEIEQALSRVAGRDVCINFTPHLIPMRRGMISTIYARCTEGATAEALHHHLAETYAEEPFVRVLPMGSTPSTHAVRGSNACHIGVFRGREEGDVILVAALDNLVKGASGQAVQNMNRMLGWPETTALDAVGVFP